MMLSVPGVSCAACIGTIERGLASVSGIDGARVNLTQKRVALRTDLPVEAVVGEIAKLGYKAFPLDTAVLGHESDPAGRDLALRLGTQFDRYRSFPGLAQLGQRDELVVDRQCHVCTPVSIIGSFRPCRRAHSTASS